MDDVFGPQEIRADVAKTVERECDSLLEVFRKIAANDQSGLVRLALASTLQRLPVSRRVELARSLLARSEDADDHNLPLLVWYGLMPVAESDPTELAGLAGKAKWPLTQQFIARRLAEYIESQPAVVEKLLSAAESANEKSRQNLLLGLSVGLKGWSRAPEPENWKQVVLAARNAGDKETAALVRDLSVLFGDGRALDEVRQIVLDKDADANVRRTALQALVSTGKKEFIPIYLPLLSDSRLNTIAAQGLSKSDDSKVARELVKNYRRFRAPQRPKLIAILVSRGAFANELLDAIETGKIPAGDLTAFDVRQIRSYDDEKLNARVSSVWGEIRESSQEKRERISALKKQLSKKELESAVLGNGRALFNKSCAKCHRLFGQGESIGPDLTGANRDNLDYLLENIVDPSAVVSKDFRMSTIATKDGRLLNGLVLAQTKNTLSLQTQTDKITIKLSDIHQIKKTALSPMPDGLLDPLSREQIRDLFGYLKQPAQVKLPKDAVKGDSK